jgi:hypothetical protein
MAMTSSRGAEPGLPSMGVHAMSAVDQRDAEVGLPTRRVAKESSTTSSTGTAPVEHHLDSSDLAQLFGSEPLQDFFDEAFLGEALPTAGEIASCGMRL